MIEWVLANLGLVVACAAGAFWLVPGIIFGISGSIEKSRKRQFGLRAEGGAGLDYMVGWVVALVLGPISIALWVANLGKGK